MGVAAATINRACQIFSQCGVKNIPQSYSTNWKNKLAQAQKLAAESEDKAKKVFFEKMPDYKDVPMPDSKNFVKYDESAKELLDAVPHMNEILRHVIPPNVRKMQAELKECLQNVIDQEFRNIDQQEQQERVFLGQYNLPNSFHELTASDGLPEAYTEKVNHFQKKGGITNFTNAFQSINGLRQNCEMMLQACE